MNLSVLSLLAFFLHQFFAIILRLLFLFFWNQIKLLVLIDEWNLPENNSSIPKSTANVLFKLVHEKMSNLVLDQRQRGLKLVFHTLFFGVNQIDSSICCQCKQNTAHCLWNQKMRNGVRRYFDRWHLYFFPLKMPVYQQFATPCPKIKLELTINIKRHLHISDPHIYRSQPFLLSSLISLIDYLQCDCW